MSAGYGVYVTTQTDDEACGSGSVYVRSISGSYPTSFDGFVLRSLGNLRVVPPFRATDYGLGCIFTYVGRLAQ